MTQARRIVVGYDGSEEARAAVAYAARRAGRNGRVLVVHAFGPLEEGRAHGRALLDALLLEGNDELADADYELLLADDTAVGALVQAARSEEADEIVVGSRGAGRVRSALGSVSHELLRQADRPVVVVPLVRDRQPSEAAT